MNAFNIYFSVTSSGKTQTYKATELKKSKEMYRISFPSTDGSGVLYTVTILSGDKIALACAGEINYTFSLIKGKKSRFTLDIMGAPIDCEVNCLALCVNFLDNEISVSGKYDLDVSGNINEFSFVLGGTVC